MFMISAALLRTVRAAQLRVSTHLRRPDAGTDPEPRPVGGPFLHWVPDHPDGCRLAGEYLPLQVDGPPPTGSRRLRRRR